MYIVVAVIFLGGFLLIFRIVHSPFGHVLKAIRENEARATSLGYDTDRYKLAAYILSGTIAGLAGATKALVFQLASLTDVHWTMSGEVVLMTLLGGLGTIFGPVVGAAVIITMQNYLAQFGAWVTIIQGVIFVICVLVFRRGIIGEIAHALKNPSSSSAPRSQDLDRIDVAIIGAGVMGAATAYWLKRIDPNLSVAVVERDYSFSKASSTLSASSIRQQFSCPVNIQLSQFGIRFLRSVSDHLSCAGEAIDLGLTEPGYLYLANADQEPSLRAAWEIQSRHDAKIALLSTAELAKHFPWLNTDGIAQGALGLSGEGWFDGPALHQAFLKKHYHLG